MIKSYFASENNQQTQLKHHTNNRFNWSIASCMLISFLCLENTAHSQNPLEQVIQEKIDQMSVAEKVKQIHGKDMWSTEDNTNLDIPGIVVSDGPHGVRFVDATAFPTGMGIATSWNPELAGKIGKAMGKEFHAYGKHQQLGPALDLCRDPRNGRSPETGGEDPFLCAHINVDLVKGIQENPTIATVKHFNGVNKQENRHGVNHNMSYRQLMEHYGYNFRRVIQDAGALSVMNAYNLINGKKSAESPLLLTHILRERWGFPFYVISDWGSVWDAKKALQAGCDLEMVVSGQPNKFKQGLNNLHKSGQISDYDIDKSVRRVLRVKYLSGMMDHFPEGNPFIGANTPEHQELALQAGREAIVLLKNQDQILPISDTSKTIALIGPSAAVAQLDGFGSSWVDPPYAVSPLEGFQNKISNANIKYAKGCDINSSSTNGFEEALNIASTSDYVVFVGGLDQTQEGENYEPGPVDRTGGSIELPGKQQELISELAKINPNLIVVIKSGGICAVPDAISDIKGFLYAFYPGMEGGHAIADVVYGDYNPSGKLPVTMPVNDAQMPVWNDDFSDDYNGGYRYYDELGITPQFAFGHGLSYTQFAYDNLQTSATQFEAGAPITITAEVTNTGEVAGEEVAQLYLQNKGTSVWMPKKELKGFEKIHLEPGETKTVSFLLTANELYYFDEEADGYKVAEGAYTAMVGGASDRLNHSIDFNITNGTPKADLEVSKIFSYPRFPEVGDSVLFLGLVKNQGTKDLLPNANVKLKFEVDGSEVSFSSSISDTLFAGGAILIGADEGLESAYWVPSTEKSFTVTATIDANNEIVEWMESNNATLSAFEVASAGKSEQNNLCLNRPIEVSSIESNDYPAKNLVDGDFSSRWSSEFSDPQHLLIDLEDEYYLDVIALSWEASHSTEYILETSKDKSIWEEVTHEVDANGGNDLFYPKSNARYIRLRGLERVTLWGNQYGHSLYEVQAYGKLASSLANKSLNLENVNIYSNPVSKELFIEGLPQREKVTLEIFDILGNRVLKKRIRGRERIDLPSEMDASQTYLIHLQGDNFREIRKMIVK
jgi:beta-glucosidase